MDRNEWERWLEEKSGAGELTYKIGFPLKTAASFRIGGPADYAVFPMTQDAAVEVIRTLKRTEIPFRVFGNCTNVLFDDEGLRGCAVFLKNLDRVSVVGNTLEAESGISDTVLARIAMRNGLSGMEFLYGIPGSLGGAVYMNGGAYGGEISQICRSVTAYDLDTDELVTRFSGENAFSYRHSVYMEGRRVVLSASFELVPGDPATIRAAMEDLMERRREKQPLSYPSAGSFFKRCPPYFAGKLIEDTGLKGLTVGGAQVSEKHAGFIINTGSATSADVRLLSDEVRRMVNDRFGVMLEREVEFISPMTGEKEV